MVRECDTQLTFCHNVSRSSDIVQWLVYLPVTQVTRVRFPVLERFFGAFPVWPSEVVAVVAVVRGEERGFGDKAL